MFAVTTGKGYYWYKTNLVWSTSCLDAERTKEVVGLAHYDLSTKARILENHSTLMLQLRKENNAEEVWWVQSSNMFRGK